MLILNAMPSTIFEQIPYTYAGHKADAAETEGTLLLDNRHYHISSGYLVPYYLRGNGEPIERRSQELVIDRCNKFLQMAEPGITSLWSRDAIEAQKKRIENTTDAREKAAHARMLVGAMVNRIERLSRVFLQKGSLEGTRIDLSDEQRSGIDSMHETDDAETIKAKLAPLKQEFESLYIYLTFDPPLGHSDLTRCVRLRDYSRDKDGLLLDLVRETAKGFNLDDKLVERKTYSDIVTKIGWTMENIDQIQQAMLGVLKVNNAMPILRRAQQEKYGEESYLDTLQEFTDLARARAGIKSDDYESYAPILARLGVLEEKLHTTHRTMRFAARDQLDTAAQKTRDLLDQGTKLILLCAEARTPINEHSPHAAGLDGLTQEQKRAESSTGIYEERVNTLMRDMKQTQPGRA